MTVTYLGIDSTKNPLPTTGDTTFAVWNAIQGGSREGDDDDLARVFGLEVFARLLPTCSCFIESLDNRSLE